MKSLKLKLLCSTNYNTSIGLHTEPFHTVGHCMRRDKDWYYKDWYFREFYESKRGFPGKHFYHTEEE